MDASSSVQVLLAVIALTGLLTGLIRALGAFAAAGLPALPPPPAAPAPRAPASGPDPLHLVVLLTAAAAEFLETESVRIHSVVELPPGDGKWPRQGRFRRHKPHRGLQF